MLVQQIDKHVQFVLLATRVSRGSLEEVAVSKNFEQNISRNLGRGESLDENGDYWRPRS